MRASFLTKAFAVSLCLSVSLFAFQSLSAPPGTAGTSTVVPGFDPSKASFSDVGVSTGSTAATGGTFSGFDSGAFQAGTGVGTGGASTGTIAGLPSGANPPIDGLGNSAAGADIQSAVDATQELTPENTEIQGGKNKEEKDKATPFEIDQTPTQSCENGMNAEQAKVADNNGMDLTLIMMLMSLFNNDSSSDSSSDSSETSTIVIKYIEVPTFIYNGTDGDGNKQTGDGDGDDDDGDGNKQTGDGDGDPSDLTDYTNQKNQIKDKFASAIAEVKSASGTANVVERAILTTVPQTPSSLESVRAAALRDPAAATEALTQSVVYAPVTLERVETTQRNRQLLRIATYAEGYATGVATIAAVNALGERNVPTTPQSAQEAARQNGISKIVRAVSYTLTANNRAAMGRIDSIDELGLAADYAGTGSAGSIVPDNAGECPVCPPVDECSVCE